MAILAERFPAATKEFMTSLRRESYIKIGETYRPLVSPILFADERKETAPAKAEDKSQKATGKNEKTASKTESPKDKTPRE